MSLKQRIMRRVYAIWFIREIVPKLGFFAILGFVGYRVAAYRFFWAKIFENFLSAAGQGIWSIPRFIASALNSVEPQFLIVFAALGIASFFLAIKLLRSMRVLFRQGYFSSDFSYSKRELG